jgi:lysylphosphatidylglycerol synthetase-like protein (DUF2156 family)
MAGRNEVRWQDGSLEAMETTEGTEEALTESGFRVLPVGLGRRVVVVANLGLRPDARPSTTRSSEGCAAALGAWQGPGLVVVAGNLFDLTGCEDDPGAGVVAALEAHPVFAAAAQRFASGAERRIVLLPGSADEVAGSDASCRDALAQRGIEVAKSLDLEMHSGNGVRIVRVEPCDASRNDQRNAAIAIDPGARWQAGLDRLADPSQLQRFLTSRLLYRRFARFAWWLLVPLAVALLLRLAFVTSALDHLFMSRPGPAHALSHAHAASWGSRLAVAGVVSAVEVVLLGLVLGWLGRRAWRALGGGDPGGIFGWAEPDALHSDSSSPSSPSGTTVNDAARARARALVGKGYAGVVSGATLQAELTHLSPGFFACAGTAGEVVEEHPGRLGMLPVFLHHDQLAWVELETGAELHARLLLARSDSPPETLLERIAARSTRARDPHAVVVAACPNGDSWPPAPNLRTVRSRSRRVRRWASAAIFLAGVVDLVSALTPPVRSHLRLVLQVLPLGASQAAGALVALGGVGLLALARGVRRGQRRAWGISAGLLGATLVLHLVRGVDLAGSVIAGAVLVVLVVNRREFTASTDVPSTRSALEWLGSGVVAITVAATFAAELALRFDRDRPRIPIWKMGEAVVERLAGVQHVALPDRLNDFLAPSLLAIGFSIAVVGLLLATRPLVDRRRSSGHVSWSTARDIVSRHGGGTLDYFALRSDKRWFFHRDSLVAYAIYGGVCLVSPDPIGPMAEREQVWGAFRRFADSRGWVVAVMGASEEWLGIYRSTGMHDIYIGDEAVVDVRSFSLAGGHMKGLRQAHNRIAKYGYTVSFHDPARLDVETAKALSGLMSQSRRGEFERGFSMSIGRIFDPRDEEMLLCVVRAPDGRPAAMCQFVPARGIGGYSLDLMRRDRGEHPNGLMDFALVSTIEHARDLGCEGLSLNFAALRSVLEGERGDGVTQRVERWALKKMSGFLQIETLWRFNAKYGPAWLPRYVVYDTAEHLVPVVLAILRAESLSEVPVIGRMIAASGRRARAAGENAWEAALEAATSPELAPVSPDEPSPGAGEVTGGPTDNSEGRGRVPATTTREGA